LGFIWVPKLKAYKLADRTNTQYTINRIVAALAPIIKTLIRMEEYTMDELVNLVAQKTGITPDQARTAVTVVLDFVKQRLPPGLSGQIDALVGSSGGSAPNLGGIGSLLGK
jgi:hypothetical protein